MVSGHRASGPGKRGKREAMVQTMLPIAPLMHGATQWATMGGSFVGRKTVLIRPPEAVT